MVNSIINPGINLNSARKNVFKKLYYGEFDKRSNREIYGEDGQDIILS
jgi:hypothetical protein